MRTDAKIDKRKVHCPNCGSMGYSKIFAQFGDFIRWKDSDGYCYYGRVAGRVNAPSLGDTPLIKDWILVLALSSNLTCQMERWVNPTEVVEVFNPQNLGGKDLVKFIMQFFGPEWLKETPQTLRVWANSGYSLISDFKKNCLK